MDRHELLNGSTPIPSAIRSDAPFMQDAPTAPPRLEPRLIKGMQADYTVAEFDPLAGNTSGLIPYGPNVLVKMDECASSSAGGVMLPDDMIERMTEASVTGVVVAMGPEAFRGLSDSPQVGQRIYIEKYAGLKARGKDGKLYRVVDEKCVACGITHDLVVAEV
jgi:chaperonin GroES